MTAISVVIPVYNAEKTLEHCLQALVNQTQPPVEIIVADNGSTDDSISIVQGCAEESGISIRLIEVSKRGAAAARNAAVLEAVGDWVAFTDSDCLPEPDWLARGVELLVSHNVAALAGPAWGSLEGDASARLLGLTSLSVGLDEQYYSAAGPTGTQGFAAANLWVRREAFLNIQGFDETLVVSGEDLDLCARLYVAGDRLFYSPHLLVRHIHASGIANMCHKMVQYGRVHALLFKRHGCPGIYLDLPLFGNLRFSAPFYFWCNAASAEKKVLLILFVAALQPWAMFLFPLYLYWTGRFLCGRAAAIKSRLGFWNGVWLAVLLVVKSAALSWGRVRGSSCRVWTC